MLQKNAWNGQAARKYDIIYQKKRTAISLKKKLGFGDEKYMRLAENLLFGELACALDIAIEEVPGYIKAKIDEDCYLNKNRIDIINVEEELKKLLSVCVELNMFEKDIRMLSDKKRKNEYQQHINKHVKTR